jgi:hypothetical protein
MLYTTSQEASEIIQGDQFVIHIYAEVGNYMAHHFLEWLFILPDLNCILQTFIIDIIWITSSSSIDVPYLMNSCGLRLISLQSHR